MPSFGSLFLSFTAALACVGNVAAVSFPESSPAYAIAPAGAVFDPRCECYTTPLPIIVNDCTNKINPLVDQLKSLKPADCTKDKIQPIVSNIKDIIVDGIEQLTLLGKGNADVTFVLSTGNGSLTVAQCAGLIAGLVNLIFGSIVLILKNVATSQSVAVIAIFADLCVTFSQFLQLSFSLVTVQGGLLAACLPAIQVSLSVCITLGITSSFQFTGLDFTQIGSSLGVSLGSGIGSVVQGLSIITIIQNATATITPLVETLKGFTAADCTRDNVAPVVGQIKATLIATVGQITLLAGQSAAVLFASNSGVKSVCDAAGLIAALVNMIFDAICIAIKVVSVGEAKAVVALFVDVGLCIAELLKICIKVCNVDGSFVKCLVPAITESIGAAITLGITGSFDFLGIDWTNLGASVGVFMGTTAIVTGFTTVASVATTIAGGGSSPITYPQGGNGGGAGQGTTVTGPATTYVSTIVNNGTPTTVTVTGYNTAPTGSNGNDGGNNGGNNGPATTYTSTVVNNGTPTTVTVTGYNTQPTGQSTTTEGGNDNNTPSTTGPAALYTSPTTQPDQLTTAPSTNEGSTTPISTPPAESTVEATGVTSTSTDYVSVTQPGQPTTAPNSTSTEVSSSTSPANDGTVSTTALGTESTTDVNSTSANAPPAQSTSAATTTSEDCDETSPATNGTVSTTAPVTESTADSTSTMPPVNNGTESTTAPSTETTSDSTSTMPPANNGTVSTTAPVTESTADSTSTMPPANNGTESTTAPGTETTADSTSTIPATGPTTTEPVTPTTTSEDCDETSTVPPATNGSDSTTAPVTESTADSTSTMPPANNGTISTTAPVTETTTDSNSTSTLPPTGPTTTGPVTLTTMSEDCDETSTVPPATNGTDSTTAPVTESTADSTSTMPPANNSTVSTTAPVTETTTDSTYTTPPVNNGTVSTTAPVTETTADSNSTSTVSPTQPTQSATASTTTEECDESSTVPPANNGTVSTTAPVTESTADSTSTMPPANNGTISTTSPVTESTANSNSTSTVSPTQPTQSATATTTTEECDESSTVPPANNGTVSTTSPVVETTAASNSTSPYAPPTQSTETTGATNSTSQVPTTSPTSAVTQPTTSANSTTSTSLATPTSTTCAVGAVASTGVTVSVVGILNDVVVKITPLVAKLTALKKTDCHGDNVKPIVIQIKAILVQATASISVFIGKDAATVLAGCSGVITVKECAAIFGALINLVFGMIVSVLSIATYENKSALVTIFAELGLCVADLIKVTCGAVTFDGGLFAQLTTIIATTIGVCVTLGIKPAYETIGFDFNNINIGVGATVSIVTILNNCTNNIAPLLSSLANLSADKYDQANLSPIVSQIKTILTVTISQISALSGKGSTVILANGSGKTITVKACATLVGTLVVSILEACKTILLNVQTTVVITILAELGACVGDLVTVCSSVVNGGIAGYIATHVRGSLGVCKTLGVTASYSVLNVDFNQIAGVIVIVSLQDIFSNATTHINPLIARLNGLSANECTGDAVGNIIQQLKDIILYATNQIKANASAGASISANDCANGIATITNSISVCLKAVLGKVTRTHAGTVFKHCAGLGVHVIGFVKQGCTAVTNLDRVLVSRLNDTFEMSVKLAISDKFNFNSFAYVNFHGLAQNLKINFSTGILNQLLSRGLRFARF